ncbi:stage VI sporulation protein F [Cytobacillus spongiae]|jgi:thiamine pyrophosphate-dependent acetolactate synthase large subunit-like protein|uniref:stage VI sporulation protein F n=1 Tax=Cytobacillus spongiae TaxID=2901381 RepID=UPI001F2ED0B1|nr:stage VI sporulation protein F [Cytobacillus spongiae]UII54330.1 stage VI sporulation protein F [Cytobacillus spongiae]
MSDMFKGIEKKTGVKMNDIMKVANSFGNRNLRSEKDVRELIGQVAKLANKRVPKQTEDMIVDVLVNKKQNIDEKTISNMLNKKKR